MKSVSIPLSLVTGVISIWKYPNLNNTNNKIDPVCVHM